MSSIIPGYQYDVFISYRQKDNKYDGWVTDFVENLKKELEATFKEQVSVYFDINPSDYLLESYDVDASLKDKLRCLVFIPVLSRTYCDSKSFAWVHEFRAFAEAASKDHYGLKIRLPNGNVASRVLPVRIHDLDPSDIKECESVLGGVLRGIEFIYREAGIDKPLAPGDNEKKNLNNTTYRIQLIKVTHSIKEIITGMRTESALGVIGEVQYKGSEKEAWEPGQKKEKEKPFKTGRVKIIIPAVIALLIIVAGVFAFPKIFKRNTLESLRSAGEKISVVVMPFQNMTNDSTWNIWQSGIQEMIINSLSSAQELKVIPSEYINALISEKRSVNSLSVTTSLAGTISKRMNSNVFIYGNIILGGSSIRLYSKLIDSNSGEVFKSFQVDGPLNEEALIQITDSLSFLIRNFLQISELKKQNNEYKDQVYTDSPEAYRFFLKGMAARNKEEYSAAIAWFKQSIGIDSGFILAARMISITNQLVSWEEGKKWCLWVYSKRERMTPQDKLWAEKVYAEYFGTPFDVIKVLRQLENLGVQTPVLYYNLGLNYNSLGLYDKAIPEFQKALDIYGNWESKPLAQGYYLFLADAYHKTLQYKKENELYDRFIIDFPAASILRRRVVLALCEGDTAKANSHFGQWKDTWDKISEEAIVSSWAGIFNEANIPDKAEEYYRKAVSLAPSNINRLFSLARFLIEGDRSINEGMYILDQGAMLYPVALQNYTFLDCYGLGLYKQGKFQKALEILEKSWDLRRQNTFYNHEAYLRLEAAKKAVAEMKN